MQSSQNQKFFSFSNESFGIDQSKKNPVKILQFNRLNIRNLPVSLADKKILDSPYFLGRYGTIKELRLSEDKSNAFVIYTNQLEASLAVLALDRLILDQRIITAYYGTNVYCTSFVEGRTCHTINCTFLHKKSPARQIDPQNNRFKMKFHRRFALQLILKKRKDLAKMVAIYMSKNQGKYMCEQNQFPTIIEACGSLLQNKMINKVQFTKMVEQQAQKVQNEEREQRNVHLNDLFENKIIKSKSHYEKRLYQVKDVLKQSSLLLMMNNNPRQKLKESVPHQQCQQIKECIKKHIMDWLQKP